MSKINLPLRKVSDSNLTFLKPYGLPKEYNEFVERYSVDGFELYRLDLTPFNGSLENSLFQLADPDNPDFHSEFVAVASVEADNICLRRGAHMHEDSSVYFRSHFTGAAEPHIKIADSFEDTALVFDRCEQALYLMENDLDKILEDVFMRSKSIVASKPEVWRYLLGIN